MATSGDPARPPKKAKHGIDDKDITTAQLEADLKRVASEKDPTRIDVFLQATSGQFNVTPLKLPVLASESILWAVWDSPLCSSLSRVLYHGEGEREPTAKMKDVTVEFGGEAIVDPAATFDDFSIETGARLSVDVPDHIELPSAEELGQLMETAECARCGAIFPSGAYLHAACGGICIECYKFWREIPNAELRERINRWRSDHNVWQDPGIQAEMEAATRPQRCQVS